MKVAAFAVDGRTSYGLVKENGVIDVGSRLGSQFADLDALISADALDQLGAFKKQNAADFFLSDVRLLKPVLRPGKILCIGVNYLGRNAEYKDSTEQAKYPSIFVRFPSSLVAHEEPIIRPRESEQLDYEGEIAVIIGSKGRRIPEEDALRNIAGYTICNEGTVRDWLRHGKFNVTPGKNFENSGSLGPWIVTPDEIAPGPMRIITRVNGELRQDDTTDRMIYSIPFLLSYISHFCTLEAGDVIITGTPTGVGARFEPPKYLVPGDVVEVEVPSIGVLRNHVVDEAV